MAFRETRSVDVSGWARKMGSGNPDLLDFEDWSYRYIQKLISDQIRGVVKILGMMWSVHGSHLCGCLH